jgi:hypothetical protein
MGNVEQWIDRLRKDVRFSSKRRDKDERDLSFVSIIENRVREAVNFIYSELEPGVGLSEADAVAEVQSVISIAVRK